jgi:hypothetical protein
VLGKPLNHLWNTHGKPTTKYYRHRRKRFPIEEIALVELFEPPAEQPLQGSRRADRPLQPVDRFAEANKFRRLPDDNVATNPAVRFRVETFEPFSPVSNGAIRTATSKASCC